MKYDLGIQTSQLRDVDFDPTDKAPFATITECVYWLRLNNYVLGNATLCMFKRASDNTNALIWERSDLDPIPASVISAAWNGQPVPNEPPLSCRICGWEQSPTLGLEAVLLSDYVGRVTEEHDRTVFACEGCRMGMM
jgi:hypothetical protein